MRRWIFLLPMLCLLAGLFINYCVHINTGVSDLMINDRPNITSYSGEANIDEMPLYLETSGTATTTQTVRTVQVGTEEELKSFRNKLHSIKYEDVDVESFKLIYALRPFEEDTDVQVSAEQIEMIVAQFANFEGAVYDGPIIPPGGTSSSISFTCKGEGIALGFVGTWIFDDVNMRLFEVNRFEVDREFYSAIHHIIYEAMEAQKVAAISGG